MPKDCRLLKFKSCDDTVQILGQRGNVITGFGRLRKPVPSRINRDNVIIGSQGFRYRGPAQTIIGDSMGEYERGLCAACARVMEPHAVDDNITGLPRQHSQFLSFSMAIMP
jgi:hypothetical protein